MIAREKCAREAGVNAGHHRVDVAAPAAEDAHALRQFGGNQVARAVVRVLNQQIFTTGGESALACGGDFAGHLAAERLVIRLAQLGFVPMGDAARTFNVGGKKNSVQHCASSFHAMESAISIIWVKAVWRACASSDSPVPR